MSRWRLLDSTELYFSLSWRNKRGNGKQVNKQEEVVNVMKIGFSFGFKERKRKLGDLCSVSSWKSKALFLPPANTAKNNLVYRNTMDRCKGKKRLWNLTR